MTIDRFKTDTEFLETNVSDDETPFKLSYLFNESNDKEDAIYPLNNAEFLETNVSDDETPFKLSYLFNESNENILHDQSMSFESNTEENYGSDRSNYEMSFTMETIPDSLTSQSQFENTAIEFERFSNEIHDLEFRDFLDQIVNEAEEQFQNFMSEKGEQANLEEHLVAQNFTSNFDQFFELKYRPIVDGVNNEIDRLSKHLEQNLHDGSDYETINRVVDSFHVEQDQLFGIGSIVNKVKKTVQGVKNLAKNVVSKVGKLIPFGPILKKILSSIKGKIEHFLKKALEKGLSLIPQKLRPMAQKALDFLNKNNSTSEVPLPYNLLYESVNDDISSELDKESGDNNDYLDKYYFEINEIERDFDKHVYIMTKEMNRFYENESHEMNNYEESDAMKNEELLDNPHMNNVNEIMLLNEARNDFIAGLSNPESEILNLTQNFIPALPLIKTGISIAGRNNVIEAIAKIATPIIEKIVGKNQAFPLSKALVDAGLKLVKLETQESPTEDQYLGAIVSNIIAETTDRISSLPEAVVNSNEDVIRSFVKDAFNSSIANNIHSSILNDKSLVTRQLPPSANWIWRNNCRYKLLSSVYDIIIDPPLASKIYTNKRAETLLDVLCKYQGWDGVIPSRAKVYVFEATPFTRLGMIAEDYLGGTSYDKTRQIISLGPHAADLLLKDPLLTSGDYFPMRYYYVKLQNTGQGFQPINSLSNSRQRNSDVDIRLINPEDFETRFYLNRGTTERIKNSALDLKPAIIYKELVFSLLPVAKKMLSNLLLKLNLSSSVTNVIKTEIINWIIDGFVPRLTEIAKNFQSGTNSLVEGVTIVIRMKLPSNFFQTIMKLDVNRLGEFLLNLRNLTPAARVESLYGYHL
jgi:hypothetical protein